VDQINKTIDGMDKEANEIKSTCLKMAWLMRGGITYDNIMNLGVAERQMIGEIVKENYETTKKSGLPHF
jgi:hypothetical protein